MKNFKQFILNLNEETTSGISDQWFDHESTFTASKPPKPVQHETAQTAGTVETLEGPVRYEAGHKIMTGPKGEKYPIPLGGNLNMNLEIWWCDTERVIMV
jgi:hypothetical protein